MGTGTTGSWNSQCDSLGARFRGMEDCGFFYHGFRESLSLGGMWHWSPWTKASEGSKAQGEEPSKSFEIQVPNTGHGVTGYGVCLAGLDLALVQYFLTMPPIPLFWNDIVFSVIIKCLRYGICFFFSPGSCSLELPWVSEETLDI